MASHFFVGNANILWVDFLANGRRLSDENQQVQLLQHAVEANIDYLIIDAKVPYGQTTYPSRYGHHISRWSSGRFDAWKGRDFLKEFLSKAESFPINILANVNVFSEGYSKTSDGLVYEQDWKVTFYHEALSKESNAAEYLDAETIFVNPIHPEVIEHELNILKELHQYDLDGVVLDRCRYPNVFGDFSELSRSQFEVYIGEPIKHWPNDIMEVDEHKEVVFNKWFPKWAEFRAHNIKQFVQDASKVTKERFPIFADYVGSWYPLYYNEGVNWASETYQPDLSWTSKEFHKTGLAETLDFLMTGCYYPDVLIEEAKQSEKPADWYSVEGAIEKSLEVINGGTPFVASLFLKNYRGHPETFIDAVRLCKERSDGVMLFDTVYLEEYHWWDLLKKELSSST
ncbi:alpha amylase family protein [Tenuibacillus multivorans]|uniref:Glycosyl hydrolase-like 10 n=1 Tax=Tenuibacillus multivorans TaxID=237069 RepID=A0A1H0BR54_9BACI|nr:alpha amylase family protein [Tenuibacillus multivorans]GEL77066.1 hypothetical protein TMU01_13010 [Tenuibacillus multivorans]SDN48088.1 Glycosyl hydrolase-like 10 [Tenuibacillus multivorans]